MSMKVELEVIYPAVNRTWPNPSDTERRYPVVLNVGCSTWKTNTAMRHGFCELLFAGCGNDPGLCDGIEGQPFDAGDRGINNVHHHWIQANVRSMSVGDIVWIKTLNEFWACDSCGWVLLTPEQTASWLQYPRQYGCSSLELSEWMETETGIRL